MSSERIPQSIAYDVAFKAYLSDGVTPATGKTIAITISKNRGVFGVMNVGATNATEIANGWYYVALDTTDTNALGMLLVHGTATGVDNVDLNFYVVNAHNAGFDGVPNAAAGASGGLPEIGTGANNFKSDSSANVTFANTSIATVTTVTNDVGITQTGADKVWGTTSRTLSAFGFTVSANLAQILGTALTESAGAGKLAAAFIKLFNVVTATLTAAGVDQTGDAYAIVNNGTYGNSSLLTAINNINNLSALANLFGPSTLVRPASGSIAYPFTYIVKNEMGQPIDVDANAVTLTAANAAGTDRSANLSAVTHSGTGEYTFTYTVSSAATDEGLAITAAGTVLTIARKAYLNCDVADADSLAALAAIQAKTDQLTFTIANQVDANALTGTGLTAQQTRDAMKLAPSVGAPAVGSIDDQLAEIEGETDDIAAVKAQTDQLHFTGNDVLADVRTWHGFAINGTVSNGFPQVALQESDPTYVSINDDATLNLIAEYVLMIDWATMTGADSAPARCALNALRKLRNKVSFDGVATLTITKEDDTAVAFTQAVAEDANQNPFKSVG